VTVSILICTHGSEAWRELALSRAYPSTIAQGTCEVLTRHEPAGTLAGVRNAAAGDATADWLCFLDADDELAPGYIAEMEHTLEGWESPGWGEDTRALLAPAVSFDGNRAAIPNRGGWPAVNECCIGTLVPRRLFHEVGGFRELPSLEDYDLWLRCAKAGAQIVHVPGAVYRAYTSPGSRNSDQSVYARLREEHAEVFAR